MFLPARQGHAHVFMKHLCAASKHMHTCILTYKQLDGSKTIRKIYVRTNIERDISLKNILRQQNEEFIKLFFVSLNFDVNIGRTHFFVFFIFVRVRNIHVSVCFAYLFSTPLSISLLNTQIQQPEKC